MTEKIKWNVLVFPGGTENGLEIYKSLRYAKEVRLFSVSSKVKNHAEFLYKNHFFIPSVYEEKCLEELTSIVKKYKIDFIFPANVLVIDFLVENRKRIPCKIVLPENNIVKKIRSKRITYEFFKGYINVPKVYRHIEEIDSYPVFIKPDSMYGEQGSCRIDSELQLKSMLSTTKYNYIITEYLPGKEYTVECFSTKQKGLLYCLSRTRERIRMGTSMHSELAPIEVQNESFKIANTIYRKLGIDGLWFFQLKYNSEGNLTLLEIECRVAGTMAYSRAMGVNLPLLSLYYFSNQDVSIYPSNYEVIIDRSLMNRYKINIDYHTVYVDLDDTLIIKGKINTDIIKFLYQCINNNKKIILVSKNREKNKLDYLKKYRLYEIFDKIIWIDENESKADFIEDKKSIFIDDSFSERIEVAKRKKIPVFDPNMIEVLIDDKGE